MGNACQKFFSQIPRPLTIWQKPFTRLNTHMRGALQAILVAVFVLIWLALMTGCISKLGTKPAKQQQSHTTVTQSVPVDQIDLNQDGQIDQQEIQQADLVDHDTPGVLQTFLAIGTLVIVVSGICAWAAARQVKPVSPSSEDQNLDITTRPRASSDVVPPSELIVEDVDDEMWCHAEQDFLGDHPDSHGGSRVQR